MTLDESRAGHLNDLKTLTASSTEFLAELEKSAQFFAVRAMDLRRIATQASQAYLDTKKDEVDAAITAAIASQLTP